MTTIISGIFGGYDRPKCPIPQSIPVDYVMVTDNPALRAPGWDLAVVDERAGEDPRFSAKRPKTAPWDYHDNGPWIWVDGSMQIQSRTFAAEITAATDVFSMWEHPDRDCLFAEAAFSARLPKYRPVASQLLEQTDHYNLTHPAHWGLWATGLICYTFPLKALANDWLAEQEKWTIQDQVSLPYVLRRLQYKPESLPHTLRRNPWLYIMQHKDGTS